MKKLVPDPPSSLTDALGSTASRAFGCRDARQRLTAPSQPAIFMPRVTGVACCNQVRPASGVPA